MDPFAIVQGVAAAIPAANIDTDVIMPKQFLKGVDRGGLRDGVFHDLRFDQAGRPRESFILNRPGWSEATFLVVGPNFGCGSSREHAVWGLRQLGIRALLGTSYAGIFFDNCARNGLLALSLPSGDIERLLELASGAGRNRFRIDLRAETIETVAGTVGFQIDPLLKATLLEGMDPVGMTLKERTVISSFEERYFSSYPWLLTRPAADTPTCGP